LLILGEYLRGSKASTAASPPALKNARKPILPSLPQQALPSTTLRLIAFTLFATQPRRLHVVADLVVLALFFLLRVGEHTPSLQPRRMIPLTETDVKLR
jgi:hypothetical protein